MYVLDLIIIMSHCYRVMGTSVNLKNRFAGYNIELVVREDSVQQIMDIVGTQLPGGCGWLKFCCTCTRLKFNYLSLFVGATLKTEPLKVEDGVLLPYNLPPDW